MEIAVSCRLVILAGVTSGWEISFMRRGFTEGLIRAAIHGWVVVCATKKQATYVRSRALELGLDVEITTVESSPATIEVRSAWFDELAQSTLP